jgi:hypothetical protein
MALTRTVRPVIIHPSQHTNATTQRLQTLIKREKTMNTLSQAKMTAFSLVITKVVNGEDVVRTTVIPIIGETESDALKTFLSEVKGTNATTTDVSELLGIVQECCQNWYTYIQANITKYEVETVSNTGTASMTLATAAVYFKQLK